MSSTYSPKIDFINNFLNETLNTKAKQNKAYKLYQQEINKTLIEIGNQGKDSKEYKELKSLFEEYGWGENIFDSAINDDIAEFTKKIKKNHNNLKSSLKNLQTKISKTMSTIGRNIENLDKLIIISECKDKVLMEFKTYLEIYIITKDFDNDVKNDVFKDKNGNSLEGKDFIKELCNQINQRVITYSNENGKIKIKENGNEPLKYNEEKESIDFNIKGSGQIDVLMLSKTKDNKDQKHILYGVDVTADITGSIDKNVEVNENNLQLVVHNKQFKEIEKILNNDREEKILGKYFFNSPVYISENKQLKEINPLEKRSDSMRMRKASIDMLSVFIKNWHITSETSKSDENLQLRKEVNNLIINYTELDYKREILLKSSSLIETFKFLLDVDNFDKLNEKFIKTFNTNNELRNEYKNEFDGEKIKDFLLFSGELTSLDKANRNLFNQNKNNELNTILTQNIYDFFQTMLSNRYLKKFMKLELFVAYKNKLIQRKDCDNIYKKFLKDDIFIAYNNMIETNILLEATEEKMKKTEEKLEEQDKKLEEKDIKSIFNIINDVFIRNEYKCETDKEKENKLKIKLEDLNENDEIDFNKYKSNPLLLKKLILKDESLKTLKYCDLTKLSKEEENYIDSLILLNITKNNTMKIIEKYKPISETVTERLTKKYESLKEIYIKYFKDDDKLNVKLKISIENYLYKKIEENKPFNKTETNFDFNKNDFESFLKNIKNNNIELLNSEEINKKLNNNYVPNFGM